jgi:hypothetical protein
MRILPQRKAWRRTVVAVVVLGVMAVLWFWVFPWADHTFVNRPAVEQGAAALLGLR